MSDEFIYKFRTDSIHYKSVDSDGKKNYYVEGYISTGDMDAYNDIVTEEAMDSMLKQINDRQITVDYDHEVWRDSNSILPVGKIVEAKKDDTGLWVKCKLNPASPKFKNLWGSVKEGFVTAFSIAFKPLKAATKTIGETSMRLLHDLELLNVALTGAPVNKAAVLTDFGMKSVIMKAIKDMEVKTMEKEETIVEKSEEVVSEEVVSEEPVEKVEEPVEEKADEPVQAEESEEEPVEEKSQVEELTAQLKSLQEKLESQEAELKSIKEKEVFKATVEEPAVEAKSETPINVLNYIR